MKIIAVKDSFDGRTPLVPESVKKLCKLKDVEVIIEKGLSSIFPDQEYLDAGASILERNKAIKNADESNFQITGTWYVNLIENKLTFSGFADLWTENGLSDNTVFLSEPQLWYHLNKTFSVGGELELSSNFTGGNDTIKGRPTLAIKWNI